MPKVRNKTSILIIVLLVWVVFSLIYIGYDVWTDFKVSQMNRAYQQGRTETVNSLISRANQDCQPFSVNAGDNKVDLINVQCLQQQQQQGGAQQQQQQVTPQE
jgi:flagellar basal body-associated protein FliL